MAGPAACLCVNSLPCHAAGWIPHILTGAAWAGLQFPAGLCKQCCPDDLIIGLPWAGHCLVFLHTISRPQNAAPWGIQSICFLFFFPVISCLPFLSFICVFCSWWPVCPITSGPLAALPQVWCAGAGCVLAAILLPSSSRKSSRVSLYLRARGWVARGRWDPRWASLPTARVSCSGLLGHALPWPCPRSLSPLRRGQSGRLRRGDRHRRRGAAAARSRHPGLQPRRHRPRCCGQGGGCHTEPGAPARRSQGVARPRPHGSDCIPRAQGSGGIEQHSPAPDQRHLPLQGCPLAGAQGRELSRGSAMCSHTERVWGRADRDFFPPKPQK